MRSICYGRAVDDGEGRAVAEERWARTGGVDDGRVQDEGDDDEDHDG